MTSPLDFTGLDSTSLEKLTSRGKIISATATMSSSHLAAYSRCISAWYVRSSDLFFVPVTKKCWADKPNAQSDDFRCGSSCWVSISEARRRGISLGLGLLTVGANGFEGSARLFFIPSERKKLSGSGCSPTDL